MSSDEWGQARGYVKRLREKGHTDEDIRQMMLEDDWEEDELEAAWQHLDVPL
jgi:hypothetical protein